MKSQFYTRLLATASLLGVIGVSVGAFGAHFLKSRLDVTEFEALRTAVLYLFIHTLAAVAVALLAKSSVESRLLKSAGILFVTGVILFSGSLFILSTKTLTGISSPIIGIMTPLGGLCFIAGWLLLFVYALSKKA